MYKERENFRFSYFGFPQLGSTLKIVENTNISRSPSGIKFTPVVSGEKSNKYTIDICGRYIEPILCSYDGYVHGFGINFNALGINYFFNKPYKKIAPKNFQEFQDVKWQQFARELFTIKDFEGRVEFAEKFLENIFNSLNIADIEKAVAAILEDQTVNIKELASLCNTSPRNLRRKFNEYVGCSPVVYKRIARFRKSIDFNTWKGKNLNYTDICYTNNFFDTSHLRKDFLKLTHQNPKEFFRTISAVGDRNFPYRVI